VIDHSDLQHVPVARHHTHSTVVTAGPIAEDCGHAGHRPRSCIADVISRVDMPEEHEPGWDLGDTLPERTAAHELHLVVLGIGGIEDTVGWAVRDQDVEPLRNLIPEPVDRPTVLHVGPVTVAWREWAAPDSKSLDRLFLVDEEVDLPVLDQVPRDEALLKGRVVVSWDEDLAGNRQGGEPVNEGSELRLVAVRVPPVGGITAVDHHVDTIGNGELVVVHVSV
jgi:hypothetical protein